MTASAVPSEVIGKASIQIPEGDVVVNDEEWKRCGSWILQHPAADLDFVDRAWLALQRLLRDGTLVKLKVATCERKKDSPLIFCYTRPGKREAERSARAIRRVVDFESIMYYNLNDATFREIADRFGFNRVSIYLHTFRGEFYSKSNGIWIKDDADLEASSILIADEFLKENYLGDKNLPSAHQEPYSLKVPEDQKFNNSDFWFMFCSCENEGPHLSEADRVWLVAQKLLRQGLFSKLRLKKFNNTLYTEVRLYVPLDRDDRLGLAACDRIFEEASCRTVMYFVVKKKRMRIYRKGLVMPIYDFIYTPDGELYKKTSYSEVYLSGFGEEYR